MAVISSPVASDPELKVKLGSKGCPAVMLKEAAAMVSGRLVMFKVPGKKLTV
jgi:hypothetical protein